MVPVARTNSPMDSNFGFNGMVSTFSAPCACKDSWISALVNRTPGRTGITSSPARAEVDWTRGGTQFQDGLGWGEDGSDELVDDDDDDVVDAPFPSRRTVPVLEDDTGMSAFSLSSSSFDC